MLHRGHHPRRGKSKFAPAEIARVVGHQMFHAAGYRQLQNVIIIPAMSFCVNQMVSPSNRHWMRVRPSSVW